MTEAIAPPRRYVDGKPAVPVRRLSAADVAAVLALVDRVGA